MIHYHGSPLGGKTETGARFWVGRHGLVPFLRKDDLGLIATTCDTFIFDNSAFSAWKKKKALDWGNYYQWVSEWVKHPSFQWAIIPDVIDGSCEENDKLIDDWPKDLPGVPVWHMHEPIERLVNMGSKHKVVALGSSGKYKVPGSFIWWGRMHSAMKTLCDKDGKPPCKLHGLRMLDPRVFKYLPLASADSTNAAQNRMRVDRFGIYIPPTDAQRMEVIASRIEAQQSSSVFDPALHQLSLTFDDELPLFRTL